MARHDQTFNLYQPNAYRGLLDVYVDAELGGAVEQSLATYRAHLEAEGYEVAIAEFAGDAQTLRSTLAERYDAYGLRGAVFVGALPSVMFTSPDSSGAGATTYPHDLYFMDLDGEYELISGGFDVHTGEVDPEIFVSRIDPTEVATLIGEDPANLVNAYFEKINKVRNGDIVFDNRGQTFIDDSWTNHFDETNEPMLSLVYGDVSEIRLPYESTAAVYRALMEEPIESLFQAIHSWPDGLQIQGTGAGSIFAEEIATRHVGAGFLNLFDCSAADYTATDYLAGAYLFGAGNVLSVVGSAKAGSMLEQEDFYYPQVWGASIGEAFALWFQGRAGATDATEDDYLVDWHNGMTLHGDPTLRPLMISPDGEPNDTIAQARDLTDALRVDRLISVDGHLYADAPLPAGEPPLPEGDISYPDIDMYRIGLEAGDVLDVDTRGSLDLPAGANTALRLFDAAGTELARNDDFFKSSEWGTGLPKQHVGDARILFTAPVDGSYFVGVSGVPFDPTDTDDYNYDPNEGRKEYLHGPGDWVPSQGDYTLNAQIFGETGEYYYALGPDGLDWTDARREAMHLGGHLVQIDDAAENTFIAQTFGAGEAPIWIGLTDAATEGDYRLGSGEPASFFAWTPGQPDASHPAADYGAMVDAQGRWQDAVNSGGWVRLPNGKWSFLGSEANRTVVEYEAIPDTANEKPYFPGEQYEPHVLQEGALFVTDMRAIDPEGLPLSFSIYGGPDAHLFTIDAETGRVVFNTPPDFESPVDVGGDNIYQFTASVNDGVWTAIEDVNIAVTDVDEGPTTELTVILGGISQQGLPVGFDVFADGVDLGRHFVTTPELSYTDWNPAEDYERFDFTVAGGDLDQVVIDIDGDGPGIDYFVQGIEVDGTFFSALDGTFFADAGGQQQRIWIPKNGDLVFDVSKYGGNTPPVAVDDVADQVPGSSLFIDVLENDFDADGDALHIVDVTQGAFGDVIYDDFSVGYLRDFDATPIFPGDSFTYTIADPSGATSTAVVTIPAEGGVIRVRADLDGEQRGTGRLDLLQGGVDDDLEIGAGDATLLTFRDVNLPAGAHVAAAHLVLTSQRAQGADATIAIKLYDEGAGRSLSGLNVLGDPGFDTFGFTPWIVDEPWALGEQVKTPNLVALAQDLVDANPEEDGAYDFLFALEASSGVRRIEPEEFGENLAAELEITWFASEGALFA